MKKGFHWILEGEASKLCVMYRTLVFGADGRVGGRLAAYLEEYGLEVVKCGRGFCDLKDLSALKRVLLSSGATHVVNCAADWRPAWMIRRRPTASMPWLRR